MRLSTLTCLSGAPVALKDVMLFRTEAKISRKNVYEHYVINLSAVSPESRPLEPLFHPHFYLRMRQLNI